MTETDIGLKAKALNLVDYAPKSALVYATLHLAEVQEKATEWAQNQIREMRDAQDQFLADLKKELEDER